jgi:Reverse transcriptase (RNA-dependent DNA polymerase)
MSSGGTPETVDGMSLETIETIIHALRQERYRWTPVGRTYVPNKHGTQRPLGLPTWSDTLLQEVIRSSLEADDAPQCRARFHGCRPKRGGHTAWHEVRQHEGATKWLIEGDLGACCERIDHSVLLNTLQERFHDNRFRRLIRERLTAGYREPWTFNATYSGVPQGGVGSSIWSNLVRDRLDTYVATQLIPANTHGHRRRTHPPYVALTKQAFAARTQGNWHRARMLRQQAKRLPSRAPNDPNFRRLWSVRDADDRLLGLTGTKRKAAAIKHALATVLRHELHLALHDENTLVTQARDDHATFLGDAGHVRHENRTHDHRRQRGMNGSLGLRVPTQILQAKRAKSLRQGKPTPLPQRTIDDAYRMVAPSQAEGRGIVQYDRMAYNLQVLQGLKPTMAVSLVQT